MKYKKPWVFTAFCYSISMAIILRLPIGLWLVWWCLLWKSMHNRLLRCPKVAFHLGRGQLLTATPLRSSLLPPPAAVGRRLPTSPAQSGRHLADKQESKLDSIWKGKQKTTTEWWSFLFVSRVRKKLGENRGFSLIFYTKKNIFQILMVLHQISW